MHLIEDALGILLLGHNCGVEVVDGYLFLQPARIRVLLWIQVFDVVFISHIVT